MNNEELLDFGAPRQAASITIIGVGGGGGNAVNRMYKEGIQYVNFIVCNSDRQDLLEKSPVPNKIALGPGEGCGSDPNLGEEYAKEKSAEIKASLEGTQMLFIAAGMGGGTGTGAAPVIAEIAKEMGILTVAIVTLPYRFEGPERMESAIRGVEALSQNVDSILIINNETLRELHGALKIRETWAKADETLATAVKAISEIMQKTGIVNVDFNDVRAVLKDSGVSIMAAGSASGENRAFEAVEKTLNSPLLNKADIHGAKKMLLNITSSAENELISDELGIIMEYIRQKAETDVNITWGYMVDESETTDEVTITMIATGFEMDDIPELRKPEAPQVIAFKSNSASGNGMSQPQPVNVDFNHNSNPVMQVDNGNITVNTVPFDYAKVKAMDDITSLEQEPAYKRQPNFSMQAQAQAEPQSQSRVMSVAEMVANRIQGTTPSHLSLDKNSKGIVLGDNKYLNHNVD
ncbi:MAG: cell division protein FtsZ [Bacteroidales bacterium]|nr:cell division protein FtsZ [Bacteroidales bacterium]